MFGPSNRGKRLTGNHIVSEKNIIASKNKNNERRLTGNASPNSMLLNL